jgi:hypothetical protein
MLLAIALVVAAADPSAFDAAHKGALDLDHPAMAVKVLVGACDSGDGTVSGECLENVKDLKDKVTNKKVFIDLGSGYDKLLSFAGRNGDKTRFAWAPLYDVGNGLALTVGKPSKISDNGNVVMNKRPIDGKSPDDLMDMDLQRVCSTGMVGIRVVGKFGKTWTMNGGGKTVKGVTFDVDALQLYNARTGAVIFESTQGLH